MLYRVLLCLTMMLFAGCTHMTASHLQKEPLLPLKERRIVTQAVAFQYQTIPMDYEIGIIGTAQDIITSRPQWAQTYSQFQIAAYVCDTKGNVIASAQKNFIPRPITLQPLPFELRIALPFEPSSQPLSIAFGYRLVMKGNKDKMGQASPKLFVASEDIIVKK